LHRRLAEAPAALMGPRLIVLVNPDIEIGLQLVDETIHLFAERDTVKWSTHSGAPLVDEKGLTNTTNAPSARSLALAIARGIGNRARARLPVVPAACACAGFIAVKLWDDPEFAAACSTRMQELNKDLPISMEKLS
jgi:hypothetical protein